MPRRALTGHALLSRCWAWLHRLVDDAAYDEWELDSEPSGPDPGVERPPQVLIDEVLRDAENRAPRTDDEGGDDAVRSS